MTERLTTEDFANRKRDENEPAEYREPVESYEQEPTGYGEDTPAGYSQYDRDEADRSGQAHAVPQQDRQEQTAEADRFDEPSDQTHLEQPADEQATGAQPVSEQSGSTADRSDNEPLFVPDEADGYRNEWRALQSDFVDDPRDAVRRADELVAQVVQSLATTFADHKRSLEGQWQQGEQIDTEELRMALRRYRSFFDRLLSV
jgi:hypothetical protein